MSLRLLAWDHPRATRPLEAARPAWTAMGGAPFVVETRSLQAFGDDVPVGERADIVLIDHPHLGSAADAGAILPLDGLLDAGVLPALAADSLGASYGSYAYDGRHWALPIDAACLALASAPGAMAGQPVPQTWADVLALSAARPGSVALPLQPAHAISALLCLLAAHGLEAGGPDLAPDATLAWAVATLATLAAQGPREAFDWEPPEALAALAAGDIACIPLTYNYVGYDVAWADAPRASADGPPGSILGGVGAAVVASSAALDEAVRLVTWLADPSTQVDIVLPCGGQPASRRAWDAPSADPMFRAVRATADAARVRPRAPWWPAFQNDGGELLATGLAAGDDPDDLAGRMHVLYRDHREVR